MENKLQIPKQTIAWIVARFHVNTPDAEIKADILRRTKRCPSWSPDYVKAAQDYAIKCHRQNQALYRDVMTGRL
jgi:hypothetical protein